MTHGPVVLTVVSVLLTSFTRTAKHDAAFAQVISVLHGRATQLPRLTRRVR